MGMRSVEAGTKWILRGNGLKIIAILEKAITLSGNSFFFPGEMLDTLFQFKNIVFTQKRNRMDIGY